MRDKKSEDNDHFRLRKISDVKERKQKHTYTITQ